MAGDDTPLKNERSNPGIWSASRASGICSAMIGLATHAGSLCLPE